MKKEVKKLVDTVVKSIHTLLLPIKNTLSNTYNNPIPQVDCYKTNLLTYSHADQDVVSDEISYSYDCTKSYP